MSIIIGETKMNMDVVKLYPSKTGIYRPVIVEYNDATIGLITPNGLMYSKGKTAVEVEIGYKLVIHIESDSKMATVILLKRQIEQYSTEVFKILFKYFGKEDVKVRIFVNERSKSVINMFVGDFFKLANITSYEVMTVNSRVKALIY